MYFIIVKTKWMRYIVFYTYSGVYGICLVVIGGVGMQVVFWRWHGGVGMVAVVV